MLASAPQTAGIERHGREIGAEATHADDPARACGAKLGGARYPRDLRGAKLDCAFPSYIQ